MLNGRGVVQCATVEEERVQQRQSKLAEAPHHRPSARRHRSIRDKIARVRRHRSPPDLRLRHPRRADRAGGPPLVFSQGGAGRQRNNLRLNQRCLAQTFQALQPTQLAQAQIAQAQLAANAERSSARDPSTRQCAQQTPCDFKAHVLLNPSFCEVQTRRAGARFASFLSFSFCSFGGHMSDEERILDISSASETESAVSSSLESEVVATVAALSTPVGDPPSTSRHQDYREGLSQAQRDRDNEARSLRHEQDMNLEELALRASRKRAFERPDFEYRDDLRFSAERSACTHRQGVAPRQSGAPSTSSAAFGGRGGDQHGQAAAGVARGSEQHHSRDVRSAGIPPRRHHSRAANSRADTDGTRRSGRRRG